MSIYLYRHNVQKFHSSALLWAANHGREATAQELLGEGANVEAISSSGKIAAHHTTKIQKLVLAR